MAIRAESVGFYSPYGWDEAAYVAVRLANLTRKFGQVPSYRVAGSQDSRGYSFNNDWDEEVVRSRKGLKTWMSEQRVIVWTDLHKGLLRHAKVQGVKNVLVPLLHRLESHHIRDLRLFDTICCPNTHTFNVLQATGLQNLVNTGWDAGMPITTKKTPYCLEETRVLVLPEWPMTNEWGVMLAYLLRSLLDSELNVTVTLLQLRQWSKVVNVAMQDLVQPHVCRINMLRSPTWHGLLHAYRVHDWAIYLPEKINAGVRLAEAKSQGLPVISWDLPSVREFFVPDKTAKLIPCEQNKDTLGRGTVRLNTHAVMDTVYRTVGDRQTWFNLLPKNAAERQLHREYFEDTWATILSPA